VKPGDEILIYSIQGKLIGEKRLTPGQAEVVFNISGFPEGIYVVRWIRNGIAIDTKKIIH
jgi:hypothetical protein